MTEAAFLQATRSAYDLCAAAYAEHYRTELAAEPPERALLGAFAEVIGTGAGPVADLGCGPGHVTAHLSADLGLDAFGIDLSPQMVAVARRTYPDLRFREGSMTALDLPDESLAGVVAWYSIIHVPPARLPDVVAGFARVLAPGGNLLLAFQVGDRPRRLEEAFGHTISLEFHRFSPDHVAEVLDGAGFAMRAQLLREPVADETTQQAFLLAHRAGSASPRLPAGRGLGADVG